MKTSSGLVETRCANCFHVTDGSEYCTQFCEDAARDWEESTVIYPVEIKKPLLEIVP